MKKRYHTSPKRQLFSLNGALSHRALNGSAKSMNRSVSLKLASELQTKPSNAHSAPQDIEDDTYFGYEMKLEDEISEQEVRGFSLSCMEGLATLTANGSSGVKCILAEQVSDKLPSFVALCKEVSKAQEASEAYQLWVNEFAVNAQASLKNKFLPVEEQEQLQTKMVHVVMRSAELSLKHQTLDRRVSFLTAAVPAEIRKIGAELGMPEVVMEKVAHTLRRVLQSIV